VTYSDKNEGSRLLLGRQAHGGVDGCGPQLITVRLEFASRDSRETVFVVRASENRFHVDTVAIRNPTVL
jgi:hypothetical protein